MSHASEDKPFVRNLVDTLIRYGVDAWYDDYAIAPGDSIRGKINEGLLTSDYGIVVLSHDFFRKKWPKQELAALATVLASGKIMPVLHGISPEEVAAWDPLLADVKALPARGDVRNVVAPIAKKVLGAGAQENGRTVYRSLTVSVNTVPMNAQQRIANTTFEDCVVQGIATFTLNGPITFRDCMFNSADVFFATTYQGPFTGVVGLDDVTFNRCRFKDIGFIVSPDLKSRVLRESPVLPWKELPPNLR